MPARMSLMEADLVCRYPLCLWSRYRVYWQNDRIKAQAWDVQFRGQVNMPYNALQGLPGCFPLLILSRRAGEYALGGPPEGSFLPSEFHDRELPSNTIIIPRVSCGYPNPNKLICKQPSPYGRDCRLHLTAGPAAFTLRPGLPASHCGTHSPARRPGGRTSPSHGSASGRGIYS